MLYRNNSVFTLCGEQHSSLCSHCESDVCYCVHTVTVTFVVAFRLWQWCSLLHSHCVESNVRRCVHTLRVTFVVLFTLCGKRRFSLCSHCDSDVRHCVHTMTVTLVVVFTCESDVRRCVHNVWRATFLVVFTLWERRSSLCSHCVESDVPACVHTMRAMFVVVFTLWQSCSSLCSHCESDVRRCVHTLCGEWSSLLCSHCESGVRCFWVTHTSESMFGWEIPESIFQFPATSIRFCHSSISFISTVGFRKLLQPLVWTYAVMWLAVIEYVERLHTLPVDLMRPHHYLLI